MKTKRLLAAFIALVMLLATVLASCGPIDLLNGDCRHRNSTLQGQKKSNCIAPGYSGDLVCDDCGVTVTKGAEVPISAEHSFDKGIITKEPTCVSEGVLTYTCQVCMVTEIKTMPVLDQCSNEYHYESDQNHKIVCKTCHKSLNGKHTEGALVKEAAASCTEDAYKIYSCSDCKENYKVYDTEKLATGHAWDPANAVMTAPTCNTAGSQYIECSNGCGEQSAAVELPATPLMHAYEIESSSPATCSEEGYEMFVCADCNVKLRKALPKIAHNYKTDETNGNVSRKTCSDCGHKVVVLSAGDSVSTEIDISNIESDKALMVELKNAAIEFPSDVMGNIWNSLSVGATDVDKTAVLEGANIAEDDKDALLSDGASIYDFTVDGMSSEFSSPVTVTLDYTLKSEEDPEGIVIWYLSEEGELTAIENVSFFDDDADGKGQVRFEVEHFSHYAIAYKETQEMRCRRGIHDLDNEDRWIKYDLSCTHLSYTVKTCGTCGYTTVTDYRDPIGHKWSEKIEPTVTCEQGGYVYQECENCKLHKTFEYIPSLGHEPVGYATCTESATCSKCNKTIVAAYGHKWGDWEITKDPTEEADGTKKRTCSVCNAEEEAPASLSAEVEAWKYNSFSELVESVADEFVGIDKGTVVYDMTSGEGDDIGTQKLEITFDRSGGGLSAVIKITSVIGDSKQENTAYYINGQMFTVDEDSSFISNIDQIAALPFDSFIKEAQLYIKAVDEVFGNGIATSKQFADVIISAYGDEIDAALKDAGTSFTAATLKEAIKGIEIFYAYYAAKLGLTTEITLPSDYDSVSLHSILSSFMTKTEIDGGVKYSYNVTDLKDAYTAMLDVVEEKYDQPLSNVCFDLIKGKIQESYPNITSWDLLIAHLKKEYGGTVQVNKLVDAIATTLTKDSEYTIKDIYAQLDKLLISMGNNDVNIENSINEFSNKTFDALIKEIAGENYTIDQFYTELDQMMKETKLGDVVVETRQEWEIGPDGSEISNTVTTTLSEYIENIREQVSTVTSSGQFDISLSDSGKLLGMSYNMSATVTSPDDEQISSSMSLTIKSDINAKVNIPETLKAYVSKIADFDYDDNGNLVISGMPENFEVEVSFSGNANALFSSISAPDKEMTDKLGYNVYVLDKALWEGHQHSDSYAIDESGNVYTLDRVHTYETLITSKASFFEVISDPEKFLPEDGATTNIYISQEEYFDGDLSKAIRAYNTVLGLVYKVDEVWHLIDSEQSRAWSSWGDEYNNRVYYYEELVSYPYSETVKNMVISNTDVGYDSAIDTDGKTSIRVDSLYVRFAEDKDTVRLDMVVEKDDILLVSLESNELDYYVLGSAVTAEYDYYEENYYDEHIIVNADNEELTGYTRVRLYSYYPSYYAEYDGHFFSLRSDYSFDISTPVSPFVKIDVSNFNTLTLPDGRTLYIVKEEGSKDSFADIYGYIAVNDTLYVKACATYTNGALTDLVYKSNSNYWVGNNDEQKYYRLYSDALSSILNKFVTDNKDGTFTFSAEGLELAKKFCTKTGDSIRIRVNGDLVNEENTISFSAELPIVYIEMEETPELFPDYSGDRSYNWDVFIGYEESPEPSEDYRFNVENNSDGSIELSSPGGSHIFVEFDFSEDMLNKVDGFVRENNEMSESTKLNIFSSTGSYKKSATYLLYGGNYYEYYSDMLLRTRYINEYDEIDIAQMLKDNYRLQDLDYQFNELNEDGSLGAPIYRSSIAFNYSSLSYYSDHSYLNVYLKIDNGKIYVLTGISTEGESVIKYEGYMLLSEYIDSLKIDTENVQSYKVSDTFFSNGKQMYTSYVPVYFQENDMYIYIDSYMTGNKHTYIDVTDYDTEYTLNISSKYQVTLPKDWIETDRNTETYGDITLELVSGIYFTSEQKHFVKIGNEYVTLDGYYHYAMDSESFRYNLASKEYVYRVDVNGEYKYYKDWNIDPFTGTYTLSNEITDYDPDMLELNTFVGYDENGNEVYECILWSTDDLTQITLSDGSTVYYHSNYSNEAYVLLPNGYYYPGTVVDDERFEPKRFYSDDYMLDSEAVEYSTGIKELITRDGYTLIIKPEILDIISRYKDSIDCVNVYYSYYSYQELTVDEFVALFNK